MKSKNLGLVFASIFVLMFLASFAVAVDDVFTLAKVSEPSSVQNDAGSFNVLFNITYNGALHSITVDLSSTATSGNFTVVFSQGPNDVPLNQGQTKEITATITFTAGQTGSIAGQITATPSSGDVKNITFSVPLTVTQPDFTDNFCIWDNGDTREIGNPGDLKITIRDITVTGFGDEKEWLPFDEVEIEVEVENRNGDFDVDNIELEWGLYSEIDDEWVIDVDNVEDFDLKDGDEETFTFTFTLDDNMDINLEDLEDGQNYILFVRATGEVDNDDNDDTCDDDSEPIELIIERDYVTLQDFEYQNTAQCGADLAISADAWNIGSKDQDEVTVGVSNRDLNINQVIEAGDINSFESEKFSYAFKIPKDAEEKSYTFTLEGYDEDNDIYTNDYDDQESRYTLIVSVSGGCSASGSGSDKDVLVSANLVSGGKAGEELTVKATITNTGDESAAFSVNAAGYGQWASDVNAVPSSLTLNAGQAGEVTFTFTVNSDASGDNLFDIEVISDDELVASQPVSVTIEPKKSGLSGIFGDNSLIIIFVIIDIILIAIIVIVAMKVAKK